MTEKNHCPVCGGKLAPGTTTFTVDHGKGVVVVRHVPANVCDQCGESWIDDTVSGQLEQLVKEAQSKQLQFEVIDMAA
ncbi:MAG TPA: type II toxin-antitoxin system MqsA family antitoxin [Gammaproteobacteria bacterium]|nr:type II toxin-antitoxin system MqsA family antitoxin [Gammaproteobacteria bacterium]